MAVTIMCPNLRCRKVLMVPTKMRGKRVRCAYCNTVLSVPFAKAHVRENQHEPALASVGEDVLEQDGGKKSKKKKK